jgi:molybdenum storage protein
MTIVRRQDGATDRLHIETELMGESLMDRDLLAQVDRDVIFRPLPNLNVVKLGGQSIIDRGRQALLPILDELVSLRQDHQIVVTTGGGTRSRHVYSIALDLGMPTGILAKLGESISEQNALMVAMLLAPHGGIKIGNDDISKLPSHLALGSIPVIHGMPPYGLWEAPPPVGRIPAHRTDVGTFLLAEVVGAARCVLVKDERGLYAADPKKQPDAEFIPEIEVNELLARDLDDLAVERSMLLALQRSRTVKEVFIVNGLERGNITRVLAGENPGTRIYRAA